MSYLEFPNHLYDRAVPEEWSSIFKNQIVDVAVKSERTSIFTRIVQRPVVSCSSKWPSRHSALSGKWNWITGMIFGCFLVLESTKTLKPYIL